MINTWEGTDCMVMSSVSMSTCIRFHCDKQLSRRLAFYFKDFYLLWKNLLCISIDSYKFFLSNDAMKTSFSSEIIKPFAHDAVSVH